MSDNEFHKSDKVEWHAHMREVVGHAKRHLA